MNYFEFHLGDWAAATEHLSDEEELVYFRLIRAYYRDERPLPNDGRQVYRLARARTDATREAVDIVLREFFTLADDGWHSKRCDEVIARHHAFLEKQRANGRAAAAKRSASGGVATAEPPLPQKQATAEPPLPVSPAVDQPPTSHFPLPTSQDGSNEPSQKTARVPRVDPVGLGCELLPRTVHAAWRDWIEHRRERKHPLGATVLRKHCEFLTSFDPPTQVEIINTSIRANWQGLFAPKGTGNGNVRPLSRADQTRAHLDRLIAEAEREEHTLLARDDEPLRAEVGGQLRIGTG